jgi:DNA damage-binding protein 1
MDSYKMEENEIAQSLVSINVEYDGAPRSYFVAGTAFILPLEEEPRQGRILVFEVNKLRKIILCHEMETKGCVYSLSPFEKNMIVASINSGVSTPNGINI